MADDKQDIKKKRKKEIEEARKAPKRGD